MKVCIIGGGLASLSLAKALINKGIYVDIFIDQKKNKLSRTRTIGLSKSNIEFFNKNILNIEKFLWNINKIEIFSENLNSEKLLHFKNKNQRLFSVIKNYQLNKYLITKLKRNKFLKFKKKIENYNLIKDKYNLIVNCEYNNQITKKYFYKKFTKDYRSYAYTAVIRHKKIMNNQTAIQTFTKNGPIAFLPISDEETSIVYSLKKKKILEVENLIKKYNTKYKIINIKDICEFELKSSDLRLYHHKNILAFGDLLHKIHPLAGQGFNMTIRDIKELLNLIDLRIDNGLDLDSSICSDFENQNRHKNFIFTNGIDFIHEFFKFESKTKNNILSKSVKLLGNNKFANKFLTKFADTGIII